MRKLFACLVVITMALCIYAQVPQKMSYQCVVRNSSGDLMTNQSVGIRISILQGTTTGTVVYQETYNPNPQTNANGLLSIEIGGGLIITGMFSSINWADGPYFLKTETDPTGGTNYTIVGTSQLLSVPYSMYAKVAGNGFSGNYYDLINQPILFNGTWTSLTGKPTTIQGYGITDAVNTTDNQTIGGNKTFINDLTINGLTIGRGKGAISNNAAFGNQALYSNTIGSRNTATGTQVLFLNSTGNNNTATGYAALYFNSSGNDNTATGYAALYSNTSGYNNTATGRDALGFNTTGYQNTATGFQALLSNTEGHMNAGNGYWALRDNTSGSFNSANGSHALYLNTTGTDNTADGFAALATNTTGNSNTANGSGSLNLTTTGNNNTANGFNTLYRNLTGNNNTAIGYVSLSSNITGQNNTGIGYGSDVGKSDLTNATAVGYYAIVDANDKVRIGNSSVTVIEGQVGFTSASDGRLKKNIKDISTGLYFITKLRPVEFQMKKGDDKINYGFIAQDIEKLVGTNNSLLTIGGDADRTLGLRYTDFIAPMVKSIQELEVIIKEQQKEIDELKEFVKAIMNKAK
jgi:trimeric autotransporter adhesin